MAPVQNDGLRNFVDGPAQAQESGFPERPNGDDTGYTDLNDYKLGRHNGKTVSRLGDHQKAPLAPQKARKSQHDRRPSVNVQPVYGTDASSIGDESTINSADARQATQLFQPQRQWQSDHQQFQGRNSVPGLTRDREHADLGAKVSELWKDRDADLDPEEIVRVRTIGITPAQKVAAQAPSFVDKHVHGDTYPSSNGSETPSQLDQQDSRGDYGQHTPISQPPDPIPTQNVPRKRGPKPLSQQIPQDHTKIISTEIYDLPIQTTQKTKNDNPLPDNSESEYAAAHKQKTQTHQGKRTQAAASKQQAYQAAVQAPDSEPAQTRKQQNNNAGQQRRREEKAVQFSAHDINLQRQQSHPVASNRPQSRVATPAPPESQQRIYRDHQAGGTAHWNQDSDEHEYDYDDTDDEATQNDPDVIDYDDDVLLKKQYEDLKNASFDIGPRDTEMDPPVGRQNDDLPTKLGTLKGGQDAKVQQHRKDFMNSLNMEQWEEAGDWFLDQFSGVINKLKIARQERRKASRAFEDEVEGRHKAVKRKHEQTEDALDTMRVSGDAVLFTPAKKTRITK